ncbi:unnamed protein product [Linum tenue]|uniref:Uncharacterized protein n=1 Tax=Linum tenue TaxID=586396 RepID=A0AAV0RDF5_9ROSI|nr:unnamed protein product [Linum tenue]
MPHKFSVNHQLRLRLIWSSVVHGSRGVVLAVPLDLAITPMRVLQDSLIGPDCGAMLEEGEVDDKFLMILFLVVERLSEKNSSWKPRVRTANSVLYTSTSTCFQLHFGNPLWFTDDELLKLEGTALYQATQLQKKPLMMSLFKDKVKGLVRKLLVLDGNTERGASFEDFIWSALNCPSPLNLA